MRLPAPFSSCTTACILIAFFAVPASAYFIVTEPHRETQWVNGAPNLAQWQKGVQDGIDNFDVEIARMSTDGLTLVAKNVPSKSSSLNVFLQDVPPGDDYFLIFINSTHGVMHATSPRFTILPSGSTPNSTQLQADSRAATVTVSGAPNPTQAFATTFPALANGVSPRWGQPHFSHGQLSGVLGATVACAFGAAWTLLW